MGPDVAVEPLPVVLVHGALGQELIYWNLVRGQLEDDGFEVMEITLPRLALGRLSDAAGAFRGRFLELLERIGAQRVDIVAHSAGGLVVRHVLKEADHRDQVRRLITLGTPHAGTKLAALVPGMGLAGDVRPGSPFLLGLAEIAPPGPTFYSAFWTRFDGIVIPAEAARLPLAPNVENVRVEAVSHWGYLYKPRLARILSDELRRGFIGGDREVSTAPAAVRGAEAAVAGQGAA